MCSRYVTAGIELAPDSMDFIASAMESPLMREWRARAEREADAARSAGSFRELAPFDQVFFAKAGDEELRVEAFGCRLKISSLLNIDPKGAEKTKHKVPFDVSSPDFIHINGVPYLAAKEIEGLS